MTVKNIKEAGLWGNVAGAVGVIVIGALLVISYLDISVPDAREILILLLLAEGLTLIPTWMAARRGDTLWAVIWPLVIPVMLIIYFCWLYWSAWACSYDNVCRLTRDLAV